MRTRSGFLPVTLVALAPLGRAQDAATYALTAPAAEKFVRATQQLVTSGAAPNVQGGIDPAGLANLKTALDGDPAAQQALSAAGINSGEYVAFMGAAMSAMMVGQMEATIEAETRKALALQDAYYGNPGDSGLKRTAAEGAILDRLDDSDLDTCGMELAMGATFSAEFRAADAAWQEASSRITQEQTDA